MFKVISIGWIKRLIARMAAESLISEMRQYEPAKLRRLARYAQDPPSRYPSDDPEESREFWSAYRRLMKVPTDGRYNRE